MTHVTIVKAVSGLKAWHTAVARVQFDSNHTTRSRIELHKIAIRGSLSCYRATSQLEHAYGRALSEKHSVIFINQSGFALGVNEYYLVYFW